MLSIVACNATALRVYILVHFIVQAMIAQHILFSPSSDQPAYGGYDYKFVGAIPSKYTCSICTKVLCDAHLTACCGQHFCASCLTHWLGTQQRRKTCPHCRQEDFQHIPNKAMIREVNEFKIRCTNHREGCGWVGELGGLKSHLDSGKGCGYVEVTCTNKGCGERVSRKDLQTHLQEKCYYRSYECEHCGHKDTYTAITGNKERRTFFKSKDHYSECPEYPLTCPNRCGVTGIRRRAMPDHHSSCPLECLDCPFKDAGCTEKIARKDMEDHMTANQQKHMLLTFQSLQQANQQVKQDLSDTKRELYDTKQELHDIKQDYHNLLQSANGLCKVGDTLTFGVRDFPKLRKEMKVWHSPPFSIGDKVRVRLAVYPNGVKRGRWSHVSVSLILMEVVQKEEEMYLQYNVSVAAIGQHTSATLELCTIRWGDNSIFGTFQDTTCCANFPFPSPGEVLQSEELFLEIEEASSLLQNDAMTLELKLLKHQHHLQ